MFLSVACDAAIYGLLVSQSHDAWKDHDQSWREVKQRKDDLLDDIQHQMLTHVERGELFAVRFSVHRAGD